MTSRATKSLLAAAVLALLSPPQSVFALLNIDGTRNQIFVFGGATFAYDSNVFAENSERGDYIWTANAGIELKRRAGIIAVNARAAIDYQKFTEYDDQSAWNPSFFLELNKTTGRTTGAITVNAYRTSRADSAVNLRTQTWNFPVGLSVKYPINDKLYVTSQTGYLRRTFSDTTAGLLTYTDYSEAIDLFYVFTSKMDLVAGYRIRVGETDLGTTTDQSFTVGVTNGLLPKVNGTVRVGYQLRDFDATGESVGNFTASAALTWNATRKLNVTAAVNRDFMTTATGVSVDTLSATVRANYIFTRKLQADVGVAWGRNRFVGGARRQDDFFSYDFGGTYRWSERFQVSGTYSYFQNWSTLEFSDFERTGYTVNLSSRF